VWRITTNGLSHGSIWVNGHNLGRYPEKIPVNSLYIPECWLQPGTNTVIIYDEEGHHPTGVTIQAEIAASRNVKICESIN
jgi:beta-galactosidase